MKLKLTPYVDLDNVLVDFMKGVRRVFNKPEGWTTDTWDLKYEKDFGLSSAEFWKTLDFDFWSTLPWTKEAYDILALVGEYEPVIITSPTRDNGSAKQQWLKIHLPDLFYEGRYILAPKKELCARNDRLLIDDAEHNVTAWRVAGGPAILWPQPWNWLRCYADDPIKWLEREIQAYESVGML